MATALRQGKTRVLDLDLAAYCDTVRHDLLLAKVARRVQDGEILHVLKLLLKASGKRGVPQGGGISPLLANIYLTEVDAMLERARKGTGHGQRTAVEYARYADDLVIDAPAGDPGREPGEERLRGRRRGSPVPRA